MSKSYRDFACVQHELDVRYLDKIGQLIGYYVGALLIWSAPIFTIYYVSVNTDWSHPKTEQIENAYIAPKQAPVDDDSPVIDTDKHFNEDTREWR